MTRFYALVSLLLVCLGAAADDDKDTESSLSGQEMAECLKTAVSGASREMTIEDLREICRTLGQNQSQEEQSVLDAVQALSGDEQDDSEEEQEENDPSGASRLMEKRLNMEALNRANRFLLTPHRRNYLLPVSYQDERNTAPYAEAGSPLADLMSTEVEFQLSVKILIRESILGDNGHLYMAYTNYSLFQAYDREASRPFRETNHQPELILSFVNDWKIFGFRNVLNEVILNHQSNGQDGSLSRSWDRIMLSTVFERGPFAFSLTPWYRIPEDEGDGPDDPTGDDNPDIEKYMGHFELSAAYKRNDQIVSLMVRNNLESDNRGAVELGWSFPVSSTVRGYFRYFNGYGHSLIDYDYHTNAVGLGITFTDLF
ncbi:phospholipase A [Marinimicrobium sp. C2-29]|uniref:phospholipase A n=1 Tax=Marinimicrobium sp. C2-29 TaxID=3139825 RepID=UPI003139CB02